MELLTVTLEDMGAFLAAHVFLSYVVLFLGSYVETLIGIGFFVYGEIFFLSGAILAGSGVLNIWFVTLVLVAGGVFGDSSSYVLGRRYGIYFFKEHNKIFNHTNYQKGFEFFQKYGPKGVFLARFLGPLSWVTPFLAGVYRVPYRTFLFYNVPGVMLGIGQFIVLGYLFGINYRTVLAVIEQDASIITAVLVLAILSLYLYKRNR